MYLITIGTYIELKEDAKRSKILVFRIQDIFYYDNVLVPSLDATLRLPQHSVLDDAMVSTQENRKSN